jgi:hypothetical protein
MQLTEFAPPSNFPLALLWPIIVVSLLVLGTAVAVALQHSSKPLPHFSLDTKDEESIVAALVVITVTLGGLAATVGSVVDGLQNTKARHDHYAAQADQVITHYPSLHAAGIELSSGVLQEAIDQRGSFVELGTGYERMENSAEGFTYMMTLSQDWLLEIFRSAEGVPLVKVEPAAA